MVWLGVHTAHTITCTQKTTQAFLQTHGHSTGTFYTIIETTPLPFQPLQELQEEPQLFVDGANRRDVVQGALGDCWFLSSCAAVARKSKLIERVNKY